MEAGFGAVLAQLRHDSGLNQRQLAAELKISQALLSHYENGTREPGLPFVCRVCDYFGVTADFILGRETADSGNSGTSSEEGEPPHALAGIKSPAVREAVLRLIYTLSEQDN